MAIQEELSRYKEDFHSEIEKVSNQDDLEAIKIKFLGRKSGFSQIMRGLKDISDSERKEVGIAANKTKSEIEETIANKEAELENERLQNLETEENIDISLPGIKPRLGHMHVVTKVIRDIEKVFEQIGFTRSRYNEVDWEHYAFESLRIGKNHPARDNWETFFIDASENKELGKMILTPHTTNADVRELLRGDLPIRMMNINKAYRRTSDPTHTPMFHQFEGLLVDKNVTLADLKGLMTHFATEFFGKDREIRLRPHHFRFTEPSFEVDISCAVCKGGTTKDAATCKVCKEGWLELGGAGMLHPEVLRAGGVDPDEYQGLAFGWGVERTMVMRSGMNIDDIRIPYKNDIRFLEQF